MRSFAKEHPERAAIYTAFLNVKGRVILDAMIIKPRLAGQNSADQAENTDIEYWVDVEKAADAATLMKHLKKYALRKQLQIRDISEVIKSFQIQTMNGIFKDADADGDAEPADAGHYFKEFQDTVEMHESEEFPGEFETDVAAFVDPRSHMMGVRVLCVEESLSLGDDFTKQKDLEEYELMRQMLGILESSKELGGSFPLNMLLHHLNGVSFEKGCYIGQELTQRTFHTGVIRRIALPFLALSESSSANLKVDRANFIPMTHVDKDFDVEIVGEEIRGYVPVKAAKEGDDGTTT